MANEQKNPSLIALVKEYAELTGCVFRRCAGGWDFINGDKCMRLFDVPHLWGGTSVYGVMGEGKYPKYLTANDAEYTRHLLEERIEILKTTKNIMKPENLELAEQLAQKRRKLKEMYDLLTSYVSNAEVSVTVHRPYSPNGDSTASLHSDTFNALMAQLVEKEINNIDELVKSL